MRTPIVLSFHYGRHHTIGAWHKAPYSKQHTRTRIHRHARLLAQRVFSVAQRVVEMLLVSEELGHDVCRGSIVTVKAFGDNVRGTRDRRVRGATAAMNASLSVAGSAGLLAPVLLFLLLSLPRGNLCSESVAGLVSSSHIRDLFPLTILVLEEAATGLVNGGDNLLGHGHLLLLAGGSIVARGKHVEDDLEATVSRVAGTDS